MTNNHSSPFSIITDDASAERSACAHMRWLGFDDARVLPKGADGGIDVDSRLAIAQVKNKGSSSSVGQGDIRDLVGTCAMNGGKLSVFYSRSGYAKGTIEVATDALVALFEYAEDGCWVPVNAAASNLVGCRLGAAATNVASAIPQTAKSTRPVERAIWGVVRAGWRFSVLVCVYTVAVIVILIRAGSILWNGYRERSKQNQSLLALDHEEPVDPASAGVQQTPQALGQSETPGSTDC